MLSQEANQPFSDEAAQIERMLRIRWSTLSPPRAARFDGRARHTVTISTDPLGIAPPPLLRFMSETAAQELLSLKATAGFLSRALRAKLWFAPGFIEAVEQHVIAMGGTLPGAVSSRAQRELIVA